MYEAGNSVLIVIASFLSVMMSNTSVSADTKNPGQAGVSYALFVRC